MNRSHLKIWAIATLTLGVVTVVTRAVWQIVVIPTPGTLLIFLPIIVAMLGLDAIFTYLVLKPEKMRSLPFSIGVSVILTAGLLAGIVHFAHFISSSQAEHFLSKIISSMILLGCVSAYSIVLSIIWSLRKVKENG